MNEVERPRVHYAGRRMVTGATYLIGFSVLGWMAHHFLVLADVIDYPAAYPILFTVLLVLMGQQLLMAWLEKPFQATSEQVAHLRIAVVVPLYNEDETILRQNLFGLLDQSRRPDRIVVVNDGSRTDHGPLLYKELETEWRSLADRLSVQTEWTYQHNQGKRRAQVAGFRSCADVDVIVTVDSDSVLDERAIEEGIKPFADPRVQSVAGINVGMNSEKNFLTRLSDLLHVQWQLVARSAQNARRRITVNSGRLAFYRSEICLENSDVYLNETFFGQRIEFSDDSMLTMYAMDRGLTVQQPTSIAFTWHPENVSFLLRQRLRWMRGWFVRSFWRMRYLPKASYAYWSEVLDLIRLSLGTVVTVMVLFVRPVFMGRPLVWTLFLVPVVLSYLSSIKYLTIRRSDQSEATRLVTFMLAPVILAWAWFVLRPLRLYAMLTYRNTGWGTRQEIEVADQPPSTAHLGEAPSAEDAMDVRRTSTVIDLDSTVIDLDGGRVVTQDR